MIFHGRDADPQFLVNLAIAEFIDPVHQKHAPRFLRQAVDGLLVEPQQIFGLQSPFLLRCAGRVALLLERKDDHIVRRPAPCAIDQQIACDPHEKARRIGKAPGLGASGGTREYFLYEVGGHIMADPAAEIAQQLAAFGAKARLEA